MPCLRGLVMPNEQTDVQESQNIAENETQENEESQTDSEVVVDADEGQDVDKQDSDFYAKELKRIQEQADKDKQALEKKLEKQRELTAIKDRALQAEKKEKKSTAFDEAALMEKMRREMRLERKLETITQNASERQLIEHHLKNSIRSSGDLDTDLKNAQMLANASRYESMLKREQAEDLHTDSVVSSMTGGSFNGGSQGQSSRLRGPVANEAARIINSFKSLTPEQKKKALDSLKSNQ